MIMDYYDDNYESLGYTVRAVGVVVFRITINLWPISRADGFYCARDELHTGQLAPLARGKDMTLQVYYEDTAGVR